LLCGAWELSRLGATPIYNALISLIVLGMTYMLIDSSSALKSQLNATLSLRACGSRSTIALWGVGAVKVRRHELISRIVLGMTYMLIDSSSACEKFDDQGRNTPYKCICVMLGRAVDW
jgi:hypothetical protein